MRRDLVTLLMLAAAGSNGDYTPVQIQKALFLMSREAADTFDNGAGYSFRAYDYGPFDRAIYDDINMLAMQGLAETVSGYVRRYRATARGLEVARGIQVQLNGDTTKFLADVSNFVRSLSFSDLVSAIYRSYPEMKENSIFVSENE